MRRHQFPDEFDGRLRSYVAGVFFDAKRLDFVDLAEAFGQERRIALLAVDIENSVAPFEDRQRSFITTLREGCGNDAAFRGATEMKTLDHAAGSRFCKSQDSAAHRAANSERRANLFGRQLQQGCAGGGCAERASDSGRMKADLFSAVQGGLADAKEDFATRDDRRYQVAAARSKSLRHGKCGKCHGGAGVNARAGFAKAVELEGMRERAE